MSNGFVIERVEKSVPDVAVITRAVQDCGRAVLGQIVGDGKRRTVYYTGDVIATTVFTNALIALVAKSGQRSWVIYAIENPQGGTSADVTSATDDSGYAVQITMDENTVNAYQERGIKLYGFKSVQGPEGGRPLVWFVTDTYSTLTTIQWGEQFQAFTSKSKIIPKGRITASFSAGIDLGQTLTVTGAGGTGEVITGDTPRAIKIDNHTSTEFVCGISQVVDGAPQQMCAFPLFEHFAEVIAPIERVLLMFAADTFDTGTVLERAVGQSVLIDLTSTNQRKISYNKKDGWEKDRTWATVHDPDATLAPLLIDTPQTLTGSEDSFRCLTGSGAQALV